MKKYINTITIIGGLVLIVVIISLILSPSWATQPGGILLLVIAALTGVISVIKGVSDAYALLYKKDEEKHPEKVIIEIVMPPTPKAASEIIKMTEVKHNLPQPSYGRFIGREKEIDQIIKTLQPYPKSQFHLITIDGVGGIGKSALVLEIATRYLYYYNTLPEEERFEAIVWVSAKQTYLTLDGISKSPKGFKNLHELCAAIMIVLQSKPLSKDMLENEVELVKNELTKKRTLVIIDNLETVDDESVMSFLNQLPAPTKSIITTRHWVPTSVQIKLSGMEENDAILFLNAECIKKNVDLSASSLVKIYNRTGGVPLAMVWSIGQISNGLTVEAVLNRLGEPTGDIVRFCFEGTIKLINGKPAYTLLLALSLFDSSATREALGFISNLNIMDRDDGLVMLDKLSLVNKSGSEFSMLPITREFAKSELENSIELKQRLLIDLKDWENLLIIRELLPEQGNYWKDSAVRGIQIPLGRGDTSQIVQLGIGSDIGVNNLYILGKPGAGKTNLLRMMMLILALKYHPDELNIYVFDPKRDLVRSPEDYLPQIKVLGLGTSDKDTDDFIKKLDLLLTDREKQLIEGNQRSFESMRREGQRKLPRVIVIFDEFNIVQMKAYINRLLSLIGTGRSLGVNFIFSGQMEIDSEVERFIDAQILMAGAERLLSRHPGNYEKLKEIKKPGEAILLIGREETYFRKVLLSGKVRNVYLDRIEQLTHDNEVETQVEVI